MRNEFARPTCRSWLSTAACLQGLLATSAFAQQVPSAPAPESNGDIIVTAQKREQRLQTVGVAVTAVSNDTLKLIDIKDATAIAKVLPSVQVNQFSPSRTVYNIRGVSQNDFSDIQEAPVAFYNDEVYILSLIHI